MNRDQFVGRNSMPFEHSGVEYKQFTSDLSRKRDSRKYLEIGVLNGVHFSSIVTKHAIGVDPFFNISANIAANKTTVELIQSPSDTFFSTYSQRFADDTKADLIFLDGLHVFEYLLRDFFNAERISDENTLIMMHDCLPLNEEMADRKEESAHQRGQGTRFPYYWTGDVWKVVSILKKYRPDLSVVCVDCPPTGLVCVTNLDPRSRSLQERYLDIVQEFKSIPNDLASIVAMYDGLEIVSSRAILQGFDHSSYFRV